MFAVLFPKENAVKKNITCLGLHKLYKSPHITTLKMQQNALVLKPAHTTAHIRAYAGDLGQLVSHRGGTWEYRSHNFVGTQKLRDFLVSEKVISGEEYSLERYHHSVNGTRFWQFHSDLAEHKRIIAEKTDSNYVKGEFPFDFFGNPKYFSDNKCCLVTEAFVATPQFNKKSSIIMYEPTTPEKFTPESILRVSTKLQTELYFFRNYVRDKYKITKDGNEQVNVVLTDLRNKLYEKADVSTQLRINFGDDIFGDYILFTSEGVILRTDVHDDYSWAQAHLISALKKILDNSDFRDAVVIRQELDMIPLPYPSHTDDKMRKLVLDARRESGQRIIEDIIANHYNVIVEKALRELEKDEEVVQILKCM